MHAIRKAIIWVFTAAEPPIEWWRVILWWEIRRLIYNAVIGFVALISLVVFFWAITTSGVLIPGEDAVEPLALIAAPFVINVLYTLGWLFELPLRTVHPALSKSFGPVLFMVGLGFSLFVVILPALLWLVLRLSQAIHF